MLASFSKMFGWFGADSNNVRTNQQNAASRKFQARRRFGGSELHSKNLRHGSIKEKEVMYAVTDDPSEHKASTYYGSSFLSNRASAFFNTCALFFASIATATGSSMKLVGDVIYFTTDGVNRYAVQSTSPYRIPAWVNETLSNGLCNAIKSLQEGVIGEKIADLCVQYVPIGGSLEAIEQKSTVFISVINNTVPVLTDELRCLINTIPHDRVCEYPIDDKAIGWFILGSLCFWPVVLCCGQLLLCCHQLLYPEDTVEKNSQSNTTEVERIRNDDNPTSAIRLDVHHVPAPENNDEQSQLLQEAPRNYRRNSI